MPILRTAEVDMIKNDEALKINIDLLEEKRDQAAIREAKSKAMMEKYYNVRVHNTSFKPADFVYRSIKASHAEDRGKLGPKWEGPYEVTEALGKGAYKLRDRNGNRSRLIFKASSFFIMSTSAVLKIGMPISIGTTAYVSYVSENGVSSLLDLIIVRCAHKTCEVSSIQFLLLSSNRVLIPSPKLLFALFTKPLDYRCLTEAKQWRIHSFSQQSLNGLSLNCFPLSDIISLGKPNLQTILTYTNFLIWAPVMVATGFASIH
nr:reverse transcriptase domain-containing protein [Tanacetum cinerariifolium]